MGSPPAELLLAQQAPSSCLSPLSFGLEKTSEGLPSTSTPAAELLPPDSVAGCLDPADLAEAKALLEKSCGGQSSLEEKDMFEGPREPLGIHKDPVQQDGAGTGASTSNDDEAREEQGRPGGHIGAECPVSEANNAEGPDKNARGFTRQRSLRRFPTLGRAAVPEYKMGAVIDGVNYASSSALESAGSDREGKASPESSQAGKDLAIAAKTDSVMRLNGGGEAKARHGERVGEGRQSNKMEEPSPRSVLKELRDFHVGPTARELGQQDDLRPDERGSSTQPVKGRRADDGSQVPCPPPARRGRMLLQVEAPQGAASPLQETPQGQEQEYWETKPYLLKTCLLGGSTFEISLRYDCIRILGKGAFGLVCSAWDKVAGEEVAIKKIHNAFHNASEAKRVLREIKLLQHLQHDNVIGIRDVIRPRQLSEFKDVYIVYELMDADLQRVIRSSEPLTEYHCQYFLYQILRGLKYLHSANVLHRDLKPGNLLVNQNCDLKIADFGLARPIAKGMAAQEAAKDTVLTEYVVTRWYRAPELLLSCNEYGCPIDIWSVGCIFAELLKRKPLFPGKDNLHQLKLVLEALGVPNRKDLQWVTNPAAKKFLEGLKLLAPRGLQRLVPQASKLARDLLEKMLQLDPSKRITVDEAFEHPYLELLHDPADVYVAAAPFTFLDDQGGDETITLKRARELIFEEALQYNPDPM